MVANPWLDGEGFASIPATHARQACSAPRRRLHWGRSEEGANSTMPDELRRRRQNDEPLPAAHEDPYTAYHDFDLPAYVGSTSFQKLPVLTDAAALRSYAATTDGGYLRVPIVGDSRTHGLLQLWRTRDFTPTEVRLAEIVTQAAGGAIERRERAGDAAAAR